MIRSKISSADSNGKRCISDDGVPCTSKVSAKRRARVAFITYCRSANGTWNLPLNAVKRWLNRRVSLVAIVHPTIGPRKCANSHPVYLWPIWTLQTGAH